MQQFFGLVDTLLKGSSDSKQRRLGYRTYRVVPCSPLVGVLEWVEGTTPLTEYLLGSRDSNPPYSGGASARWVSVLAAVLGLVCVCHTDCCDPEAGGEVAACLKTAAIARALAWGACRDSMKSEECSPRAEAVWAAHSSAVSDDALMLLLSLWLPTYPHQQVPPCGGSGVDGVLCEDGQVKA